MGEIPFFDTRAAFAMRVGQLANVLYEQMEECLEERGLRLPGYATSIVQALFHGGEHSITDLAQRLRLSHQLASQRVKWLAREGFVTMEPLPEDGRVRIVKLTDTGQVEAEKLQAFLPDLLAAYSEVFDQIGVDLHQTVLDATAALRTQPLGARFRS